MRAQDPSGVLSLQRAVGNRATRNLLSRTVVTGTKVPMVRFSVGSEVSPALAAAAWARTTDGALDDQGIAALPSSPGTLSSNGTHRRRTQSLDDQIVRMSGTFSETARKTLALATSLKIDHREVCAAMLAAASDSTPGDRALAGAAYVLARAAALPESADLLAGRIKVDEVPPAYIGQGIAARYQTGGASMKGDTVYMPSTFDVDDLDQQGTVVHELTHAADDKAATAVTTGPADRMELRAFRAQARYYLSSLHRLSGDARARAIETLATHAGPVRVYTMLMEANVASIDDYDDLVAIVGEINARAGALGARQWRWATAASNDALEPVALNAIRPLEHLKPGDRGQNDGLSGESILDWKLRRSIGHRAAGRVLARSPTPQAATQQQEPFTLIYMNKFGDVTDDADVVWRPVALDDPEFVANYVDFNIDHGTATVTLDTGQYDTLVIHYRDGRRLSLPRDAIPSYANNPPTKNTRVAQFGEFVRHKEDGFIYPTLRHNPNFSLLATPNLVSIREQADATAKELAAHRVLISVAAAFANIMSLYGLVAGQTTVEDAAHRPAYRLGIPSRSRTAPSFTPVPPEQRPTSRPVPPGGEEPPTPSVRPGGPAHNEPVHGTTQQQHQDRPGRLPHDIEQQRARQQEQMAEQRRRQEEHNQAERGHGQRHPQEQQQQQSQYGRDARTQRREGDRYHDGAKLGLSREQIEALRQEVIVRSTVEMPPTANEARRPNQLDLGHLAADHRGEGSHFDLGDPQAVKIIVDTINEPQAILVARNGAWVFYKSGTVVVTQRGAPNVLRTAYGRGGRVTSRTIAKVRATNPKARVGDPEAPVKIDDLVDRETRRDLDVVKIWP